MPPRIDTPPSNERNQSIYERRQQGESLADIARDLGISTTRVEQIVKDVQRKIDFRKKYPILNAGDITLQSSVHSVLKTSNANALYRAGLKTLQDVADLVAQGVFVTKYPPAVYLGNRRIRNFGSSGWKEVASALDGAGFDWRQYATTN